MAPAGVTPFYSSAGPITTLGPRNSNAIAATYFAAINPARYATGSFRALAASASVE
jgi:hypothetical protein